MPLPDLAKIVLALLLIAPLALPMGMLLPLGLVRTPAPLVPWAWAINGSASVLSAVLATILARELGFTAVVAAAILLYLGAAIAARGWPIPAAYAGNQPAVKGPRRRHQP